MIEGVGSKSHAGLLAAPSVYGKLPVWSAGIVVFDTMTEPQLAIGSNVARTVSL